MNKETYEKSSLNLRLAGDEDLVGIQTLLEANHKSNVSEHERAKNGFVTYRPNRAGLAEIIEDNGIIIATDDQKLVGYLCLMTREYAMGNGFFEGFIERANEIMYEGKKLANRNYIVFAQICVDKDYRGRRIPNMFYDFVDRVYGDNFDIAIAEIDDRNKISLNSSKKAGFVDCGAYHSDSIKWHVVAKRLNNNGGDQNETK